MIFAISRPSLLQQQGSQDRLTEERGTGWEINKDLGAWVMNSVTCCTVEQQALVNSCWTSEQQIPSRKRWTIQRIWDFYPWSCLQLSALLAICSHFLPWGGWDYCTCVSCFFRFINENKLSSTEHAPADLIISSLSIQMGHSPFNTAGSAVMQVLCMTDAMEIPKE